MDQVIGWFLEYGYWILIGGLFLEFLFLPFPGATVMTVAPGNGKNRNSKNNPPIKIQYPYSKNQPMT